MMPLLSIIVPVYKVESYLRQCIDSIINQTWTDFELILVDDGSPDKCGEICDEYGNTDQRIKVVHQENQGLSVARNTGLEIARGKYLAFVDSDDWLEPDMYKILITLAEIYDAEIAECRFEKVFEDGRIESFNFNQSIKLIDNINALKEFRQEQYWHVVVWNKIYCRNLWDGIRFPPGKAHEDEATTYKLYYKADKIVQIDTALINYRQRPDSIVGKPLTLQRFLDCREAYEEKVMYFQKEKIKVLEDLVSIEVVEYLKYAWLEFNKQKKFKENTRAIKKEFNLKFKDLLETADLSLKQRLVFSLFYISPSLYTLIFKFGLSELVKHSKMLKNIYEWLICIRSLPHSRRRLKSMMKSKNLFLFPVPLHGNLGDQAITYAEFQFASEHFPEYNVIEILYGDAKASVIALKRLIKNDDLICLQGGGNMGDEYLNEEHARRFIIKHFPHTKIISFPQTIYFSSSEYGKRELSRSRRVYSKHKHLTLIAREQVSYEIMQKEFPETKVLLMPDMVFNLNQAKAGMERQGILCCLRADLEGVIQWEQKLDLLSRLKSCYPNLTVTDTVIRREVHIENRETDLHEIWDKFRSSKVVITDRLHGMIFAAITATPCVVLSNYNHKVQSSYHWLQGLDYIRYVKDFDHDTILQQVNDLFHLGNEQLPLCDLRDKFKEISEL